MRLLVVLPVLPWPARRDGMAVRFLPVLQYLASRHIVDLVVIDDIPDAHAHANLPMLASITFLNSRSRAIPPMLRKLMTAIQGISPFGAPLGQMDYRDRRDMKRTLQERIAAGGYAAVLVSGAAWMMSGELGFPAGCRVIYDFVDSPTLHMRRGGWLRGIERGLRRLTEWKCARLERRIRRFAAACVYVSAPDAEAIGPLAGVPAPFVIPNGVIEDALTAGSPPAHPKPVVGFLGNMGYIPNIRAVRRLAQDVMPWIDKASPGAHLLVIGRDPTPEVQLLAGPRITVTGTVPDIWPYVRQVRVFVFPMLSGAGLQNKILEAMHAGVPVVTTPLSAQSLGAVPGEEVLVADSDEELGRLAARLLQDEALWRRLSEAGHQFISAHHSWSAIAPRYESVILGSAGAGGVGEAA
ncbi:MAG: glycosyltransferase [Proteobacteria bacterium]|nr:glycosyltransferase [Pseudomonadota bacterium]